MKFYYLKAKKAYCLEVKDGQGVKVFQVRDTNPRRARLELEARYHAWKIQQNGYVLTVPTVWEVFEEYIADYRLRYKETSARQQESRGKAHLKSIGNAPIDTVTRLQWQRLIDQAAANGATSPATLKGLGCLIRQLCQFAAQAGYISDSAVPHSFRQPLGLKYKGKRAISRETLAALFSPQEDGGEWFIPVWRFLFLTGLRRGELCALQRARDYDGATIHIRESISHEGLKTDGKTANANRIIPLNDLALDALKLHQKRQKEHKVYAPYYLFTDPEGIGIKPRNLRNRWQRWQEKNGFEPISLHELRHSHISYIYKRDGVELEGLKALVGHSEKMDTVKQYVHDIHDDEQERQQLETLKRYASEVGLSLSDLIAQISSESRL